MTLVKKMFKLGLSIFMAFTLIQLPIKAETIDLALHKPATASSFEVGSTDASKAVDGNVNTHWGTAQNKAKNEWLEVDLGSVQTVKEIAIMFERKDADQNILGYKIDLFDGTNYLTVFTKKERAKQNELISLPQAMKARKIKITILDADSGTNNWVNVGISKLSVYGSDINIPTQKINVVKNATMSASNVEENLDRLNASKAADGDLTTRWSSNYDTPKTQWLKASFAAPVKIQQINVNFLNRDVAPNNSNVEQFSVKYTDENGQEKYAVQNYKNTSLGANKGWKTSVSIVLPQAIFAKDIKICEFVANSTSYNNIGITELEAYADAEILPDKTPDINHTLKAVMRASTVEENLDRLNAAKAGDGNMATRWSSNYDAPKTQWLKATYEKPTQIKEINIHFLNRDVTPNDSNVEQFSIKYTDTKGNIKYAVQNYKNTSLGSGKGWKRDVRVLLDNAIVAKDITVCEFVANSKEYNNISINELETYSNEQKTTVDLNTVVSSIKGSTVASNVNRLPMPTVPDGYTVAINGADFEQIVGKDGSIVHPLTDKKVQLSFIVTETTTKKTKTTNDIEFIIAGKYQQPANMNTKPKIIPEIAEWYAGNKKQLNFDTLKKVVYSDSSLATIVDEFILDYQDFTGIKLQKQISSTPVDNAFNFLLQAPDKQLGNEGYRMDIQRNQVLVKSAGITGNMYAMQTILQMYKQNQTSLPQGIMRDYPRFPTRGFVLDAARKPFSMDMLQTIARTMRYYKMNDFQVHLSDNYIFLEQYGHGANEEKAFDAYSAFRLESSLTNAKGESPTSKDLFFTKKQFKNFIQSERASGMNIVPEIDVPAHATAFTKVWPELMVKGKVSPLNGSRPLVDSLDVSKPETIALIKKIFDDYTNGKNPTFDAKTTIHIGADEFLAGDTAYRNFLNTIIPYVKKTNPVRMWGGLTWIDDGKTEINEDAIKNVQVNLWSSDWADGVQMYNMGYKLINTIDDYTYMVPNGNMGRANAYGDLLNVSRIFDSFQPNRVRTKRNGYQMLPSGSDQVLGAAFAIWNDNSDKSASGLSESDEYWRFFDSMPFFAEKTWAATGKEKGTAENLSTLAKQQGTGPNTNPYYQEKKIGSDYEKYDFSNGLKDASENKRDLTAGTAKIENNELQLSGGKSYVTSPIKQLGNDNKLSFDITLQKPAMPGQILFESDSSYGTRDIRIMDNGKLGFTRELYDYSFNYALPVGKQVHIDITTKQQKTSLYVNDDLIGTASGEFIDAGMVKKTGITNATFALPLQRIGSKTNAVQAMIDNVVVSDNKETSVDLYHKDKWTGTTNSETKYDQEQGLLNYAFDNKSNTIWHSNWQTAQDKLTGSNSFYASLDLGQDYKINQFSFTPRQDTASGQVTKADLFIKAKESDAWKQVAKDQIFKNDSSKKSFLFPIQDVRYVKFVAKASNDGWVAVSEFDVANQPAPTIQVYTEAEGPGTVSKSQNVTGGTSVTVTAVPDSGSIFDGWYSLGKKISGESSYTFTANNNIALTAKFLHKQYDVTIDGIKQTVNAGTIIKVKPKEKPGYHFDGYFEEGSNEPFDFSKPIDKNITVVSKFTAYKVMIETVHNGTATLSEMNAEGKIDARAVPDKGYHFVNWTQDGKVLSDKAVYTFIPVENMNIMANFAKNESTHPDIPSIPNNPDTPDQPIVPDKDDYLTLTANNKQFIVTGLLRKTDALAVKRLNVQEMRTIMSTIKDQQYLQKIKIESIFDINVLRDGKMIQPNGDLIVKIKMDKAWTGKALQVVNIDEDGKLNILNTTIKDGYVTFTTSHLSKYAIASYIEHTNSPKNSKTPETGDFTSQDALWSLILLSSVIAIVCFHKKRRKTMK